MGLVRLLFRCPVCGHDPTEPKSDRVFCPDCRCTFEPATPNGETRIRVRHEEGTLEVQAAVLTRRIQRFGGAGTRADDGGVYRARAQVRARFITGEAPYRLRDRLMGFIERIGPPERGELVLDGDTLGFEGESPREWRLDEMTALQTTSSSVQISFVDESVVSFRLEEESVRRWEDLLRRALSRHWAEQGRGEIHEFQPRIR